MSKDQAVKGHFEMLEQSVQDIIQHQKQDTVYIQQTLYFLRYTMVSGFLEQATKQWLGQVWATYQQLSEYTQKLQAKTHASAVPELEELKTTDRIMLYQMQQLGILAKTKETTIELTPEEQETLHTIQREAQVPRNTRRPFPVMVESIKSDDPKVVALGNILGLKLG
jgi:hypothetical protein